MCCLVEVGLECAASERVRGEAVADKAQLAMLKEIGAKGPGGAREWNRWRMANPKIRLDFRGAHLPDVDLAWADLSGADLSQARLEGANLADANLNHAFLLSTGLSHANFRGARLNGANLSGAELAWVPPRDLPQRSRLS
jgi:uncharacterized protein YjbI with pentapeptide repeats